MVTLHDSLVSSSARPLAIRKRADLRARRQQYLGRSYWVVKEPMGLNYYRFQEEEYAILQMLDGHTSLDEIKERFEADFPPQKITLEELQQFLGMLHRSGLVIANVPGQGRQLRKRRSERRRKELLGSVTNILWLRFKGIDPERILNWLYPYFRWCFSPLTLLLGLILVVSAGASILVEFDTFRSKLPAFHDFFNVYNAFWIGATLAVTKVLHEFGHGLSCKHFGGECHELGVMLLVLTPCLYCNVSDSWMLPNKWHRAAIGAAGICVELTLASICTFIWWFTEPGLLHYLCLNVMFVCSVSTIVFNGNPLLRYDGYYILADLVEIPNLRQKATTILSRKLAEWCLGMEQQEDPFLPERNQIFFALYSVAAAFYRWFVLFSILWFMYQVFKPYGLQVIGQAIVLMSLVGLVVMPAYKVGKFFYVPGRLDKVKKPRMYISLGVLSALVLAVLFVPLPHSVVCTLEVQPRDAFPVYVDVAEGGTVDRVDVAPGQQVTKGQTLAVLSNRDLDLEIVRLKGARDQYERKLKNLGEQRVRDPSAGNEYNSTAEALKATDEQLAQKQQDKQRLVLTAPADGTVLPPPETPNREDPDGQLPTWSGTPLEAKNLGAPLEEGVLFCQIGDPHRCEAILVIDQTDIEFVHARQKVKKDGQLVETPGQTVDVKLSALPSDTFRSELAELAESNLKVLPKRLSAKAGGELAATVDPVTGAEKPRSTSYQARVPLDDPQGVLRLGLRGQARIYTDWQPLGKRLWRLISHTFNFKM